MRELIAWTPYKCVRCTIAISCSFGVACVNVEQKEHVKVLDDRVTYWVYVSRTRLPHGDQKRLVMVESRYRFFMDGLSPTSLDAGTNNSAVQPLFNALTKPVLPSNVVPNTPA